MSRGTDVIPLSVVPYLVGRRLYPDGISALRPPPILLTHLPVSSVLLPLRVMALALPLHSLHDSPDLMTVPQNSYRDRPRRTAHLATEDQRIRELYFVYLVAQTGELASAAVIPVSLHSPSHMHVADSEPTATNIFCARNRTSAVSRRNMHVVEYRPRPARCRMAMPEK